MYTIYVHSAIAHTLALSPLSLQDNFLDALHAQNMESHRDALAEVGVDTDDIAAPDVCLVGVFIGSVGD